MTARAAPTTHTRLRIGAMLAGIRCKKWLRNNAKHMRVLACKEPSKQHCNSLTHSITVCCAAPFLIK